jgi:hypothetical protein
MTELQTTRRVRAIAFAGLALAAVVLAGLLLAAKGVVLP